MKKLFLGLFLIPLISCNQPWDRKETIHEIHADHIYYYVTSEITIKDGCAHFIAWDLDEWKIKRLYVVCGTFQIMY